MTTQEIMQKLQEPFSENDIEWRIAQAGSNNGKVWAKVLAYVTNRAIMDRLDNVVGIDNWKNEYREWKGGQICKISIKLSGEWIGKEDGADDTHIEAIKGGLSGAMKRSAVQWGIGRYLYKLDEYFAIITDNGKHWQKGKQGEYPAFKWNPPNLPSWALPGKHELKDDYQTEVPKGFKPEVIETTKSNGTVTINKDIELNKQELDTFLSHIEVHDNNVLVKMQDAVISLSNEKLREKLLAYVEKTTGNQYDTLETFYLEAE